MGIRNLSSASATTGTKRSKVWDQAADLYPAAMHSIQTIVVPSAGATSITFSSIPQTYSHLQLRGTDQENYGSNDWGYLGIRFNSDSGANYTRHQIWGSGGGSVAAYGLTGQTSQTAGISALIGTRTQFYAGNIIDVMDYKSSKYKTTKAFGGADFSGSGGIGTFGGTWLNTSAITSITIINLNGAIQPHSAYTLYGIKG